MPIDYGAPTCPQTQPRNRQPGEAPCPRSDTYRAIESGDAHSVFGWMFRCRTCGTMFFRTARGAGEEGKRLGVMEKMMRGGR